MQLGYVILYVQDVPASVAFYEKAFGLKRRFLHESNTYGEMETGATALAFADESLARSNGTKFEPARPDRDAPAVEVAFVVDDPAAAHDHAVAAGAVSIAPAKKKPWGQIVAYVRDNSGFLVELCTSMAGS
jgi:lactoylglutathione lyase